jgi:hypothetical protein
MAMKDQCRSFNFQFKVTGPPGVKGQPKGHICELNSASRDEANGDVVPRPGFLLYDFDTYIPFLN